MKIAYRPEIDGLRAIAVTLVVLYHADFQFRGHPVFGGGFIGVDIFFVLSGFLITSILLAEHRATNDISILRFYERRVRRIIPALFLVMLASAPFAWRLMSPKALTEFAGEGGAALLFGSNIWFWLTSSYTAAASQLMPLLHTWTLSLEEQFYLFFPPLLIMLLRFAKAARWLLLLMFALSLGLAQFASAAHPDAAFYLLPTRGWELLAGALVALSPAMAPSQETGGKAMILADATALACLAVVIAAALFFRDTMRHPSLLTAAPVLATAALLRATAYPGFVQRMLSVRPMVQIGLISYSFYLWHFPVFAFVRIALGEPSDANKLILIGISAALAALTYSMVEGPFRNKALVPPQTLAVTCGGAFLGLLLFFGLVYEGRIAPARFAMIEGLIDFKYDSRQDWREGPCFIEPAKMTGQHLFDKCEIEAYSPDKPTLLLWGDSHAAHLFAGYDHRYRKQFNIIQRTASLCWPMVGENVGARKGCKNINEGVWAEIRMAPPDVVVIAAAWGAGAGKAIEPTIDALRKAGVERITLVGPVPRWEKSLPEQLTAYIESKGAVPKYLDKGVMPLMFDVDKELSELARSKGLKYQSPIGVLCRGRACLTKVGGAPNDITQFDYGHLTRGGSIYLVERFDEETK